jgi:hypothetical protein
MVQASRLIDTRPPAASSGTAHLLPYLPPDVILARRSRDRRGLSAANSQKIQLVDFVRNDEEKQRTAPGGSNSSRAHFIDKYIKKSLNASGYPVEAGYVVFLDRTRY